LLLMAVVLHRPHYHLVLEDRTPVSYSQKATTSQIQTSAKIWKCTKEERNRGWCNAW